MKKHIIKLTFFTILLINNIYPCYSQNLNQLKESIGQIIKKHNVPGASFSIVLNDSTQLSFGVGEVSANTSRIVSEHTRFRVGSIAKSFISLGLLKLQEDNKLNLNDRLVDVIPEIEINNPWTNEVQITIRHLLEHTAGLNDMEFKEIFTENSNLSTIEAITLTPSALKVTHKPGTYHSYSNPGYLLAGYILEKFAKEPYEDYLKREILEPLGMLNSTFNEKELLEVDQPIGHVFNNNTPLISENKNQINRWAGSLVTTSSDMAKFLNFLIDKNSFPNVLNKASRLEMENALTSLSAQNGIKTGYALGNMKNTYSGFVLQGNKGGGYNLHARYFYINTIKKGYFFATNASHGLCSREIDRLLFKFITNNSKAQSLKAKSSSEEEVKSLLGFYSLKTNRINLFKGIENLTSGMELSFDNGALIATEVGKRPKEILVGGQDKYFYKGSAIPHILIKRDNNEGVFIDTNNGGDYYVKSNKLWFNLKRALILFALIVSAITIIVFPIKWIVSKIRIKQFNIKQVELIYFFLPIILIVIVKSLTTVELQDSDKLGTFNARTALIWCLTVLYPILTIIGALKVTRIIKSISWIGKLLGVATMLTSCILTVFMIVNGYVGLQLW